MSGTAAAATMILTLGVGMTHTPMVMANDVTVPPAMCVAPFLDQAFPMRWHEHYLMNPPSGTTTYVICPLTYDNDVVTWNPEVNLVRVTGGFSPSANLADAPNCFFTVADRTNLSQVPYINGTGRTYQIGLATAINSPIAQTWQAQASNIPRTDIASATGSNNVNDWSATVFCRLPPGYGISNVFVGQ
jgi:hypothetical protein